MANDNLKKGDSVISKWNNAKGTITGLGELRIKITLEDGTIEQRARWQFDLYYTKNN
jgi:hypothetical protein